MATADEIRAQIAAKTRMLEQAQEEYLRVYKEKDEAIERQKLRRELDDIDTHVSETRCAIDRSRYYRQQLDRDLVGPYVPWAPHPNIKSTQPIEAGTGEVVQGLLDCAADVVNGEIEWCIRGFSWLEHALLQNEEACAESPTITVAGHRFQLIYAPREEILGDHDQKCSLAIYYFEHPTITGATFRYTISIKSKSQGYVEWGAADIFMDQESNEMLFGPDVCGVADSPAGIFGMSHAQLKTSEWVIDDVLTAKLKVQVRPFVETGGRKTCVVPPSRLGENLLFLLDNKVGSDCTFTVQGETIRAHSQILSAVSNVLQRLFFSGMRESTSKDVIIDDCEPAIFKEFLRYLYSDSFSSVESFVSNDTGTQLSMLQSLLALSHKYQVTRLQIWCECQLMELISTQEVCSVLVQAHLHEAKRLERRCLDFIAANMSEVAKTESFGSLSHQWPEVSLKVTLRVARLSEDITAAALQAQETSRKRKREE